jgi:predicted SprT family Zn-dependent metalloprotease
MIDLTYIEEEFQQCLSIAKNRVTETWVLAPAGISIDTHKTKYGQVYPSGEIKVSSAFIGTNAYNKLKETINHELAHCIVGLHQNHNRRFKSAERLLNNTVTVPRSEMIAIYENTHFKWRLLAHLESNCLDLGGAHKRTAKYTKYHYDTAKVGRSIQGKRIIRFEFVAFDAPLAKDVVSIPPFADH